MRLIARTRAAKKTVAVRTPRAGVRSDSYAIGAATPMLDLLVVLAKKGGHHTISALARELGLTFSRVYRLVATLEAKGFIERDPATKLYGLGPRTLEVGMRYLNEHPLVARVRPHLEQLAAETLETTFLAIRDDDQAVYVDRVDSSQAVRFQTDVGARAPWHCVAAGMALVSAESDSVIKSLLSRTRVACVGATPTRAELEREIAEVRARGFSINFGQWHADVAAVASPLVDHTGRPVAALVIGAPLMRVTPERANELGALTRAHAQRLETA
jgi:IclR family transcriptional regulator, KDG regulon repressor